MLGEPPHSICPIIFQRIKYLPHLSSSTQRASTKTDIVINISFESKIINRLVYLNETRPPMLGPDASHHFTFVVRFLFHTSLRFDWISSLSRSECSIDCLAPAGPARIGDTAAAVGARSPACIAFRTNVMRSDEEIMTLRPRLAIHAIRSVRTRDADSNRQIK